MRVIKILHSNGQVVPYEMVKQHEEQVMSNHGQTVEQICDRGGLDWTELYCVLNDVPFSSKIIELNSAKNWVLNEIDRFNAKFFNHAMDADKLGLRTCTVNYVSEGNKICKRAYFHKWCDRSDIVKPSPMIGGHPGGVIHFTTALVEYDDGVVAEVSAKSVTFTDRG